MARKSEENISQTVVQQRTASEVGSEYLALTKQIDELTEKRDALRGQLIAFIKDPTTQAVSEKGKSSLKKVLGNGITLVLTFSEKRAVIPSVVALLPENIRLQLMSPDLAKVKKFYKDQPEDLDKIAPVSNTTETLKVTE